MVGFGDLIWVILLGFWGEKVSSWEEFSSGFYFLIIIYLIIYVFIRKLLWFLPRIPSLYFIVRMQGNTVNVYISTNCGTFSNILYGL